MSILIDEKTPDPRAGHDRRQGQLPRQGNDRLRHQRRRRRHARQGRHAPIIGLPVFNTVKEAVRGDRRRRPRSPSSRRPSPPTRSWKRPTRASGSICSITDGIPAQDMMRVKRYLMRYPEGQPPDDGRPQLRRHHQPRQGDARHHAGAHLYAAARSASSRAPARSAMKRRRR